MKKETVPWFQNTISSFAPLTVCIGLSAAYPIGKSMTGTGGGGIYRIREYSFESNPPIVNESNPRDFAPFRAIPDARYVRTCDFPPEEPRRRNRNQ